MQEDIDINKEVEGVSPLDQVFEVEDNLTSNDLSTEVLDILPLAPEATEVTEGDSV
jgi:hypothetical protein